MFPNHSQRYRNPSTEANERLKNFAISRYRMFSSIPQRSDNGSVQNSKEPTKDMWWWNSQIKLNKDDEESKYSGGPLIVPRTPYHQDYTPRQHDKTLPFFKRTAEKLKNVSLDFVDYSKDIF